LGMSLISRAACGAVVIAVTLSACVAPPPQPRETSSGHLSEKPTVVPAEIPEPVAQAPFVPPPKPEPPVETYTVVVNEVPVKELLFALSRDAKINVDVHPNISGNVTLNAVDQTLSQILDRISRQIDVRHELRNGTIVVMPDTPFLRSYKIDYVNVTRESAGTIGASTLIAAGGEGGGGANTSQSTISNTINNRFWETLQSNVEAIVRQDSGAVSDGDDKGVTLNREGGLILVRATARQHQMVSDYLDKVMASITRQVLIEATIVEVQLSDRYQAGIDWTALARSAFGLDLVFGADVGQAFEAGASGGVTGLIFDYADKPDASSELDVTINLLNEFGDAQVLSSPKVMTLNNQPAVLKVVDNEVYFEIDVDHGRVQRAHGLRGSGIDRDATDQRERGGYVERPAHHHSGAGVRGRSKRTHRPCQCPGGGAVSGANAGGRGCRKQSARGPGAGDRDGNAHRHRPACSPRRSDAGPAHRRRRIRAGILRGTGSRRAVQVPRQAAGQDRAGHISASNRDPFPRYRTGFLKLSALSAEKHSGQ
jgi:hypothetical protein